MLETRYLLFYNQNNIMSFNNYIFKKEKPLLAEGFLTYIKTNNFKDKSILEIGSGYSTLFFSKYFKKVYSYESDKGWYDLLINKFNQKNINNVKLYLHDEKIFSSIDFLDQLRVVDMLVIDGNIPRSECAYMADRFMKEDSVIVLDDGVRNMVSYKFLKDNYYCTDYLREDEYGITPTSIFFKKINLRDREYR